MDLGRFSFGTGDRFGRQAAAQLAAIQQAIHVGVHVTPVWNKSHREHTIIGTHPADVRRNADAAVAAKSWARSYFIDADHINLANVDAFLPACDFFTLDVSDFIGRPVEDSAVNAFIARNEHLCPELEVPGLARPLHATRTRLTEIARQFLAAVQQTGNIYRHIALAKGAGRFITEVSFDEANSPQSPLELLFILEALAHENIPVDTIAPKFSGRFNKGVDYVGDVEQFAQEFRDDVAIARFAAQTFGLPPTLKLSVHSGSDKFSLYGLIRQTLRDTGAGLHVKTAGTTWLEELIGLAESDGPGLEVAREIYKQAHARRDELCRPYATVIDIRPDRLPDPATVSQWPGHRFAAALRHDSTCPDYSPDLRQLLHVGYRIAAEMGPKYLDALDACESAVARNVTENLLRRHLLPIFPPA
ncbi:MAG: hypothetical protein JW741_18440 [Sedimentisphaerales bacterium]|nr:hypothetical protein [Sedimentisphaerales bacterium]